MNMANKLKEFLYPSKNNKEMDTSTVLINKEDVDNMMSNHSQSDKAQASKPLIFSPKKFMQVEEAANELINGKSIIVDLSDTDLAEAKRICDFLNGVNFSCGGEVKKIAKLVYLFSRK